MPADFIGFANPHHPYREHHDLLVANLFAQSEALAFGRAAPRRAVAVVRGQPPVDDDRRRPAHAVVLGQLIALYEHIVFVQGVVWDIDSFDQWGVELGKELANQITPELSGTLRRAHDTLTAR